MCGFLGVHNNNKISKNLLRDSLSLLIHRGKDSTKDKYLEKLNIFLGFQRLAIQDLSRHGDQPMSDSDQKVHIVFNGEIYNFKLLRSELQNSGIKFYNQTDTEILLEGYKLWGIEKLLSKIEGMFAFSITDETKKQIYLARDKFGMKPIFYSKDENFIFSSECKSILKLLKSNQWDYRGVINPMFTTFLPPEGKTIFKNINELKPGNYLKYTIEDKSIEILEYFSPRDFVREDYYNQIKKLKDKEVIELYNQKIKNSVSKHLISDVPLGILFSAGIDSSLIAKMGEKINKNKKQELFFFNTNDENFKFLNFAKNFSETTNYNLNIVSEDNIDFSKSIIEQLYYYETPNKPEGIVLSKVCKKAYKNGFKVLLTGDAADELFGGYSLFKDFYTAQLSSNNIFLKGIVKLINKLQPLDIYNFTQVSPSSTAYFLQPSKLGLAELPFNLLMNGENRLSNWKKNIEAYDFIPDQNEKLNQAFILDGLSFQLERYLLRSDRLGMKETVELRIPFLDDEFVKLVLNTPLRHKIGLSFLKRKIETKKILREVSRINKIPNQIINRKKYGTPFVYLNDLRKLCSKINFNHCSDILKIKEDDIKKNLLNSFDEDIDRSQYGFLAIEIIGRLFIENKSFEDIERELAN